MNKDFKKELRAYEETLKQEVIGIVKKQWVKENSFNLDDDAREEFEKLTDVDDKINFLNEHYNNDDIEELTIDLDEEIENVASYDVAEEGAVVRDVNCITFENGNLHLYWWGDGFSWENVYLEDKEKVVRELKEMFHELD